MVSAGSTSGVVSGCGRGPGARCCPDVVDRTASDPLGTAHGRRGAADAGFLAGLPPRDAAAQVRGPGRRAAVPPRRRAVEPVAARAGPAHGRGGALVVPPPVRRTGPRDDLLRLR